MRPSMRGMQREVAFTQQAMIEQLKYQGMRIALSEQTSSLLQVRFEAHTRAYLSLLPDDAARTEYQTRFQKEFKKLADYIEFVGTLSQEGSTNGSLPIRDKIELVRTWNSNPDNEFVPGYAFGLPQWYIDRGTVDFTMEEWQALATEFQFALPEKEATTPATESGPEQEVPEPSKLIITGA